MKQFLILFIMLALSPFLMAASSIQSVLFEKDGTIYHGMATPLKAKKADSDFFYVTAERYLSAVNYAPISEKIHKKFLIYETTSISGQIQSRNVILRKGMIVLDSQKKPALIEAVFPNGMVSLRKLEVNLSSRFRLDQNTNFAPIRSRAVEVADATGIAAIEQECFLGKYCKDQAFKMIEGIPLCASGALKGLVGCGKTNVAHIGAVFSDGTLLLHTTLINPFPKSTLKYYSENAALLDE